MEALGVLRFWRNAAAGAEARSDVGDARCAAYGGTDDEESDEEDSFIDLVFNSHNRGATEGGDEASRKDFQFIGSPRDVFLSKVDFSSSKPMSPITILRSAKKFKLFVLSLRKPSECRGEQQMVSPLNQFSRSSSNRNCHVSTEKSVRKYLNLIKPLYIKVSKKVKLTDYETPSPSPVNPPPRKLSEGSRLGSFKIVASSLGKSRSASAAVGAELPSVRRRDEPSLVEQHDGIQGAILHCKKSYHSSSQEL